MSLARLRVCGDAALPVTRESRATRRDAAQASLCGKPPRRPTKRRAPVHAARCLVYGGGERHAVKSGAAAAALWRALRI